MGYAVLASLVVGGLAVQEWMAHWLLFRPWGNTPNVTRGTARGLTLFVPLAAAGIVLTAAAVDRLDARLFGPRATPEPPHAPPAGRRLALMALILGAGLVVLGRAIAV